MTLLAAPISPLATSAASPAPVPQRYYIMGATSLPEGSAFTVVGSYQHLLTEFTMGTLSVAEVVDFLTEKAPALLQVAA